MSGGERSRPPSWLAPLTVVLLGLATILAFGYSQRLKREPLVVDRAEYRVPGAKFQETVFSPNGDCRRERIRIVSPVPQKKAENVRIIREEIAHPGLSVIIARRACVTYAKVIKEHRREHKAAPA